MVQNVIENYKKPSQKSRYMYPPTTSIEDHKGSKNRKGNIETLLTLALHLL